MATANEFELSATDVQASVPAMPQATQDPVIANWDGNVKSIPDGYRLNKEGTGLVKAKRKSGGKGTRTRKGKKEYQKPDGGFRTSELKDFVVGTHAKPKISDFADPLDYQTFNVWYCEQLLNQAKRDKEQMLSLGATIEDRKANLEELRLRKMVANKMAEAKATNDPAKIAKTADWLQSMLAELM